MPRLKVNLGSHDPTRQISLPTRPPAVSLTAMGSTRATSSSERRSAPRACTAMQTAIRRRLLPWFTARRRDLPWRRRRTPYRVWVAEIMLQQTRADTVAGYYPRFLRRFPSMRALAQAPRAEVLKAWEGLGYYARARRLHETAIRLVRERGGRLPQTLEELRALPGVGSYTAAAIGSLAFGLDAAAVDGNIARVLARLAALPGDPRAPAVRRRIQTLADSLLVPGRAGDCNEALMELGATLCAPRAPRCGECPLQAVCKAHARGRTGLFPQRRPRRRVPHKVVGAAVTVNRCGEVLVAQRPETSMLGGLWEFPGGTLEPGETMQACIARELQEELGVQVRVGPRLVRVAHAYSHFTIDLHAHWARIQKGRPRAIHCAAFRWLKPHALREPAFSAADLKIVQALENQAQTLSNLWKLSL